MKVPRPPVPPPPTSEQLYPTAKQVINKTKMARQEIFEKERENVYYEIRKAACEGNYSIKYKLHDNCNKEDVTKLKEELINKGFKVEIKSGLYGYTLEISWWPEE